MLIPAGEFNMGRTRSTPDDLTNMRPHILLDDRPVHRLWIDAFLLDTREVSNEQYSRFVLATRRQPPYHWVSGKVPAQQAQFPVFNVSWDDAQAYCSWSGGRLPTEAEWERAARGGQDGLAFPWGDQADVKLARFAATRPGPVGEFPPNGFGLHDMVGGVAEWCADWFDRLYYRDSPAKNPAGPPTGVYKVIRGGAWSDEAARITVFFRNWVRPQQRTPNIGFRCARNAGEKP